MIESTGQETRAFILQARHTLVTSQPEVTLLRPLCSPFLPRSSLLPPAGPTIVATTAAIVSKYHVPINHREHRILYLRTIREGWRRRRRRWRMVGRPVRSKLTRRRLFYFPPPASANRWKSSTQLCRAIRRSHSITRDEAPGFQASKFFFLSTLFLYRVLFLYEINESRIL